MQHIKMCEIHMYLENIYKMLVLEKKNDLTSVI